METPREQKEIKEFWILDFIKAFSKLVYITLYWFPTSKKPPSEVLDSKGDMDRVVGKTDEPRG